MRSHLALFLCIATIFAFRSEPLSAQPTLRAAALEFAIAPKADGPTVGKTGALVRNVAGPLKTTKGKRKN